MPEETRVRQLLEEILDSERTPEEVCAGAPDLLPEVRARWERLRRVQAQMDVLFPSADATHLGGDTPVPDIELPQVDGYDVEAVLGRGGMGVVFRARQLSLNRPVALSPSWLRSSAKPPPNRSVGTPSRHEFPHSYHPLRELAGFPRKSIWLRSDSGAWAPRSSRRIDSWSRMIGRRVTAGSLRSSGIIIRAPSRRRSLSIKRRRSSMRGSRCR